MKAVLRFMLSQRAVLRLAKESNALATFLLKMAETEEDHLEARQLHGKIYEHKSNTNQTNSLCSATQSCAKRKGAAVM